MNKIFISYRREDSEGFARGLFQSLANYFGKDAVFMDVDSIGLGMDFVEAIDKSLDDCGALLVLIGKDWTQAKDSGGRHRLEKTDDFVRIEIAKALKRKVPVIPVLVKGASLPDPEDLPEELQALTRRQALELRHESWDSDVEHLATSLEKLLGTPRKSFAAAPVAPPPEPSKRSGSRAMKITGVVLAVFLALCVMIYTAVEDWYTSSYQPAVTYPTDVYNAPQPTQPNVKPYSKPETPALILTGAWIDQNGVPVKMVQQGMHAVSQSIDPETGAMVQANWQINGSQLQFSWVAATGNNGYGQGTVSADYNTITYEYFDQATGLQGYGRMQRTGR